MAKNAFEVFIPMSADSSARKEIIFDFFDLLAAIAARGRTNGLGGRKLSRYAGWWAFEHSDDGKGFDGGYKSWAKAADATSHLFFSYLRSLAPNPESGVSGISKLPRSLQSLLSQTEYPPETPTLMQKTTSKVVMIVESVSPTPFSLLRRARNFEYRDDDRALQEYSSYEDPVQALTDECRRVLECISSTNQSAAVQSNGSGVPDASWSRFEDIGFSSLADTLSRPGDLAVGQKQNALRGGPLSQTTDLGRPTTPSWADFLSSGFPDDRRPSLLSPDKQLPLPVGGVRGHSSQSHRPGGAQADLEPGELASIAHFDLDETFWWVWMTSLAGEEPAERKAVFGRCTLIETEIAGHPWLLIEEQVKGASPGQEEGAYIAEKKSRFSFTRRGRLGRRKTTVKKEKKIDEPYDRENASTPSSKIGPEQQAKISRAAAQLAKGKALKTGETLTQRSSRLDEEASNRHSMLSIGPLIQAEASTALQWTSKFDSGTLKDKEEIRAHYLNDKNAGTGRSLGQSTNLTANGNRSAIQPPIQSPSTRELNRGLPAVPKDDDVTTAPKSPSPPSTPPKRSRTDLSKPLIGDDKPVPNVSDHPAYRRPSTPEPPKIESSVKAVPKFEPKKVSPKQEIKKLQKKDASSGGGFKKLFGRKKVDKAATAAPEPARPKISAPIPIATEPIDTYDSPPRSAHNDEPTFTEPPYESPVREHDEARQAALEKLEADREFSRFDQGPLDDIPAFVPEVESDDDVAPPPILKTAHPSRIPTLSPPEESVPRSRSPQPERKLAPPTATPDNVSEKSIEPPVISASDRWAQIRKNAAERAQRVNDDQRHGRTHSQSRSDDGETSGEETIESRVARIKARVAELTGKNFVWF
jgi:Domain of unknown function (DUF1708)